MTLNEMSCKELVEVVTDYFENRLPTTERVRFEAHLATCQGCQTYLDQMRQTMRLLGTLTEENVTSKAQQELLRVFRDWKAKPSSPADTVG